jgi:hypothetical protein
MVLNTKSIKKNKNLRNVKPHLVNKSMTDGMHTMQDFCYVSQVGKEPANLQCGKYNRKHVYVYVVRVTAYGCC